MIAPYTVYVKANDQSLEYTGKDAKIDPSSSGADIFKDENGTPVDEFVLNELAVTGVTIM